MRQLCLYRRRRNPLSYVPEHALAPVKASIFLPYIFSHDEVLRILSRGRLHRWSLHQGPAAHLILVLYCTGIGMPVEVMAEPASVSKCLVVWDVEDRPVPVRVPA